MWLSPARTTVGVARLESLVRKRRFYADSWMDAARCALGSDDREPGTRRLHMSRTWLITGASRGFGRRLAEAVLESGDQVVATARRPEQLDDLVARYGEQVRTAALDVTDPVAARAAVAGAVDAFG